MIKAGTPREAIGFSLHLLNSYQVGPISQRMQDECGCFPPAFTVRHGVFFQLLLKWSVRLKGGWVMYMINKWLTAYVVQREKTKQERVEYKSTWWGFFFLRHTSLCKHKSWLIPAQHWCLQLRRRDQAVSQSLPCAEWHPDRMIRPLHPADHTPRPFSPLTIMPRATGLMAARARISSKSDS